MVMTTGAAECQSQDRATDRVDLLVDDIHLHFQFVDFGQNLGTDCQKPGGNQVLVSFVRISTRQQISRQLFHHELIEGSVPIQRFDDVIAIAPGIAVSNILIEAVRVCIASDIQPVPSPSLTIRR